MAQTQFFTKSDENLENYKSNFKKALQKIKIAKLFDGEVIDFLEKWIDSQKSYISRDDVDNLGKNIDLVYKDKDFYEYITNWKYPMDLYNKICVKDEKTWNIKKYNLSFNNLHNFIWRFLICTSFPFYYDKQFEKEQNIRVLRENILNNLN